MRRFFPAFLVCVSCGPRGDCAPEAVWGAPDLESGIADLIAICGADYDAPGAAISIAMSSGERASAAVGDADLYERVPLELDHRFKVGSVTKTVTATAVLSLYEEGALSLDDPVVGWLPDAPISDRITIRQLMGHTSGLPDYMDHEEMEGGDRTIPRSTGELLAMAEEMGALWVAGEGFKYANTNYLLLGLLIEEATGREAIAVIQERVLDPAGMHDTIFPDDLPPPEPRARGYYWSDGAWQDVSDVTHPANSWTASAMMSTPEDLVRLAEAMGHGTLLGDDAMAEMLTLVAHPSVGDSVQFAHGTIVHETELGELWSHRGHYSGHHVLYGWFVEHEIALSVTLARSGWDADPKLVALAAAEGALAR